ncbi:aromatic motif membrane protein [Mycoplasmopsis arginini]|uniref:aromatic motif membrane protein n=1 Tax=Mycoplasmopsis arginini TaxID=2094 RepID=UPI002732E0D2|nr:aromatic motif membrane protein [Mycoplasmopsis arginini]MDP4042746.1 hypothetical protein [Mycoplasmopsis arginini]
MKKLLLTSLSSLILPFSAISCVNTNNNNDSNSSFEIKQKKYYYKNESINSILDFYTKNSKNNKNIYIFQQENKSDAKYNELKYAFVYDPIFIQNSVHRNGDYNYLTNKSKDIIEKSLSDDWYWVLNNLSSFKYIFNPYGDRYIAFPKEKEYFNQIKEIFKSLFVSVLDSKPTKLIKFPFQNIEKLMSKDVYTEKEAWYLIFDNNKAIKLWKYIENDTPKIQILPDLLVFKNTNNIEEQLTELEGLIHQKRLAEFNSDYESAKEDAEFENEDFDEEAFLNKRIDKKYIEFQGIYKYNGHFVDAINEINKEELKIYRFSMRFIDEKN